MDIPDTLYRRVRAKGALDGLTLRAITINLYMEWLERDEPHPVESQCYEPVVMPSWGGLCSGAIARHAEGPHDLASIRQSIARAPRLATT